MKREYKKGLMGNGKIPLMGFWGPYDAYDSDKYHFPSLRKNEIYKEIAEAGFNIVIQTNDVYPRDKEKVEQAIKMCKDNGITYFPSFDLCDIQRFHSRDVKPSGVKTTEEIVKTIEPLIHDKAVSGIFVIDEPFQEAYGDLGKFMDNYYEALKILKEEDKFYFICLLPKCGFTGMGPGQYESYVADFVDVAHSKYIMFDYYPFQKDCDLSPGLYNILGVVREQALKRGVPFGACIQMGGNWTEEEDYVGLRRPLPEEVLWEVNFMLCAGCEVFEYFTLCNPHSFFKYIPFHGETGAFLPTGEKSDLYYGAQKANAYANNLSKFFINGLTKKVIFNEGFPGWFEDRFEDFVEGGGYNELKEVKGKGVITGCFDYFGQTMLYVVNTFKEDQKVEVKLDNKYDVLVGDDKNIEKVKDAKDLSFDLKKGEAKLILIGEE